MFAHLNVHSCYSPMRGTSPVEALVKRAVALGMTHLALTEVNGLWGFVRFTQIATHNGMAPICGAHVLLGANPGQPPEEDFVVLVENRTGYANLCRLLSQVHDDDPGDAVTLLKRFGEGLFVLCPSPELLRRLAAVLPADRLFGELRPGRDTTPLLRVCAEVQAQPIATGAVGFRDPEDVSAYEMLRAIDRNSRLSELPDWERLSAAHYLAPEGEIRRRYPHCPNAVDNAGELARRCCTEWDFTRTIFPGAASDDAAAAQLHQLACDGAARRYGTPLPDPVTKRLEFELDLIIRKGFASYFLVVADIVDQTRLTIGRGSAAASIVSYCLFITQVDPILHNLTFERFLHEERVDLPDIDVDFAWDERDDILDYVFNKYGRERSAMVANHVTLQPRSAVREVGKVRGLSNEEILAVTRRISLILAEEGHPSGGSHMPYLGSAGFSQSESAHAPVLNMDGALEEILQTALSLVGVFHYPSVHSGGVIVVPDEIRKYVPVLTAPKGVPIVQWEKDQVEDAGLVKIDLLGNRSLAVVRDCLKYVNLYRTSGKRLEYHDIRPVGDARTAEIMSQGATMGIFYIESPATRQLLAKAGKADFEHVVIYSSIIRPAANRFCNLLVDRIHGAPWKLDHPDLDFLRESYGIMVYEEQVFLAARIMAGFSYTDADTLRKIGTKRSLRPRIPALKEQFVSQSIARGYDPGLVQRIWEMIESFKGYSFCKPHSASYAMLSFTCAHLKAHYPAEFLAAVISNRGGYYSPYAYMSEARRRGVRIFPPHINRSLVAWKGHAGKIRVGFMEIRNLQAASIQATMNERKQGDFTSLADFLGRMQISLADTRALIRAGSFDDLEGNRSRPDMLLQVMEHYAPGNISGHHGGDILAGIQRQMNGGQRNSTPAMRPLTARQLFDMEIESFGYPISRHPLEPFRKMLEKRVVTARNLRHNVGRQMTLAGVCLTTKTVKTRAGEAMQFLTFEDQEGLFECVLFPAQYKLFNDLVRWEKLFLIRGKVEENWDTLTVNIEKLASLGQTLEKWRKRNEAGRQPMNHPHPR